LISPASLVNHEGMMQRVAVAVLLIVAIGACRLKETDDIPAPPDVAAPPADAITTPSGLASKVISPGMSSVRPEARSTVRVHYTGWTTDGRMFDSSYRHGQPFETPLTSVIPGWTEGVQLMVVGEKRRFWIPGALAYDNVDRPGAPKGMLVFDIELLAVQ